MRIPLSLISSSLSRILLKSFPSSLFFPFPFFSSSPSSVSTTRLLLLKPRCRASEYKTRANSASVKFLSKASERSLTTSRFLYSSFKQIKSSCVSNNSIPFSEKSFLILSSLKDFRLMRRRSPLAFRLGSASDAPVLGCSAASNMRELRALI